MEKVLTRNVIALVVILSALLSGCLHSGETKSKKMKDLSSPGMYGYDVGFFMKHNIKTIELKDNRGEACVLVVPGYQGRVMTSTADGSNGKSFGWINYKHIESGKLSPQFNPFGGEERLWLGPEGGPYSIYFKEKDVQEFSNWVVPPELDTEPFEIVNQSLTEISFRKEFILTNASGTEMNIGIDRKIRLLELDEAEKALGMKIDNSLSFVAYQTDNVLINKGTSDWTEKSGALSLWMLSMFNPSEKGVVFIPFKKGDESVKIVNDDYFGKVPSDRLIVGDGIIFFKTDGKFRSKIGLPPERALSMCGSYDPVNSILTLLWYSLPRNPSKYVNSKWGEQDDPFLGDAVNSYNDGPVQDGSIMGPFYEIESSSPAAFLKAGERITHTQRIYHLTGNEAVLSKITEQLFNLSVSDIKEAFN